jgi:hypothetical protein
MAVIPDNITLEFGDGQTVRVPHTLVKKFRTVHDAIEEMGVDGNFPIPNVSRPIFDLIKSYSDMEDTLVYIPPPDGTILSSRDRPAEVAAFFEKIQREYIPPINPETGKPWKQNRVVFDIINAANYLNYNLPKLESGRFQKNALLQEACREIAIQIMGKTPDQLKEAFDIVRTFTDEDKKVLCELKAPAVGDQRALKVPVGDGGTETPKLSSPANQVD